MKPIPFERSSITGVDRIWFKCPGCGQTNAAKPSDVHNGGLNFRCDYSTRNINELNWENKRDTSLRACRFEGWVALQNYMEAVPVG